MLRCTRVISPFVLLVVATAHGPLMPLRAEDDGRTEVLVTVDGTAITAADLEFLYLSRKVHTSLRPQVRRRFLETLVDRALIRAHLADRQVEAPAERVEAEVKRVEELIAKTGDDPAEVLAKLGYDEDKLRDEVALPMAWTTHVRRIVTRKQLREFFAAHREEFDGTEIRASQIVLPAGNDEEATAAEQRLAAVREEILAGRTTFAEAARRLSAAPSAKNGGDVGFFAFRGKMPVTFSEATFPLKVGEVSPPFRTPFGVHIATVTERRPGQLSLEDVRPEIIDRLAARIWDDTVARLRRESDIAWRAGTD